MPLPLSGQLCMSQIRAELGIPSQAPFCLDTAENGGYVAINQCSPYKPSSGNPACISEWYGYCHTCPCTPSVTPTLPLGECWQITNSNSSEYLCVTYIARDGTSTFTNLGPAGSGGETSVICIKANTGTSILGTYTGGSPSSCSGGSDIVIKTYLGYSCTDAGNCIPVSATPSPTRTPSITPTPSNPCTSYFSFNLSYSDVSCSEACGPIET